MTTVTKKKGEPTKIIQPSYVILEKPSRVESADMLTWKDAVNAAKQGRYRALYNLYENALADSTLWRVIDKRIGAVTNAELAFLNSKNERDLEVEKIFDSIEFEMLLREIMLTKMFGFSVIDILSTDPFAIYSVPRKNINRAKKLILPDESNADSGFNYENEDYIFEIESPGEVLGEVFRAIPYVIYKRGGWGDYAQFCELFGMPFRLAKYSNYDIETRKTLIKAMKESGGAGWAVVPKESEFSFIQNTTGGNGILHANFLKGCREEIAIAILGQTMTTVQGDKGARSLGEVHKDVEESINKADRRFVQRVLNSNLLPILEKAGFKVTDGFFSFPEAGEVLTTSQKVDIALKMKEKGVPVPDDYLYEVSGVPKPSEKDVVSSKKDNGEETEPDKNDKSKKKEKKESEKNKNKQESLNDESVSFIKRLRRFFAQALSKRAVLKY